MAAIRISARAIIRRGDEYLVVRYRDGQGDWLVFPGGGQQHGEDLHQALHREVQEEIGAKVTIGQLRFVRECIAARLPNGILSPDFHQVEIFFDCTLEGEPLQQGLVPDPGQIGTEWLSPVELRGRRFFPQAILNALSETNCAYLGAG